MELLKWELRKIWRPGNLAAILLLGAVYYWMFPQFYIEHFCNGPQSEAQFDLASDWVERRSRPLTHRSPPSRKLRQRG